MRQRLVLELPAGLEAGRLGRALAAGDVAAVVLPREAAEGVALVATAQEAEVAALVTGAHWPAPFGADGLHVVASEALGLLAQRPEGALCGVTAAARHEAMTAGEAGADYVWFDGRANLSAACALANWWQALFEVPAVIAGRMDPEALPDLVGTRAEFVALVDVFGDDMDEAALVAEADRALGEAGPD